LNITTLTKRHTNHIYIFQYGLSVIDVYEEFEDTKVLISIHKL